MFLKTALMILQILGISLGHGTKIMPWHGFATILFMKLFSTFEMFAKASRLFQDT